METRSLDTEINNPSFAAFLNQVQSKPLDFTSHGKEGSTAGNWNSPPLASETEKPEIPGSKGKEEDLLKSEEEVNPIESFLRQAESKSPEFRKEGLPDKQDSPFMISFLVDLVHSIKNTLASIHHATLLTIEKTDDSEIRQHSRAQVTEDIKKLDTVLNSLLNFISINTPIAKTNTLYVILEEILEANEKQFRAKNLKIIRKCDKDLPETHIHNEQVRFVLHSILQYAVLSTPTGESIWFSMKALDFRGDTDSKKRSPENKGGYVEVVIEFNGDRKLSNQPDDSPDPSEDQKEATDLILRLVETTLEKNRGSMMVENNGKRPKTLITLRFPIERRNVVYYEPINI